MNNQPNSKRTIGNLTLLELEKLIENIAKKTFHRELTIAKQNHQQLFSETFGAWEDEKTDQEIIKEIYDSRNSSLSSF